MLQLRGDDQLGAWGRNTSSDVHIIHCYRKPRSTPSSWAYFSHDLEAYSAVAGTRERGAGRVPRVAQGIHQTMNPLDTMEVGIQLKTCIERKLREERRGHQGVSWELARGIHLFLPATVTMSKSGSISTTVYTQYSLFAGDGPLLVPLL